MSKEDAECRQQVSDLAWRAGTSPEASAAAGVVALNLGYSPVRKSYQNSLALKSAVTRTRTNDFFQVRGVLSTPFKHVLKIYEVFILCLWSV